MGNSTVSTANFNSFDLEDLGDGLYEDSHGGIFCTLRFSDKQTYVPQDGPKKGLTHYSFLPEQLTEKIEALGYTQIRALCRSLYPIFPLIEYHFLLFRCQACPEFEKPVFLVEHSVVQRELGKTMMDTSALHRSQHS